MAEHKGEAVNKLSKSTSHSSDFRYDEEQPRRVFMMSQEEEVREKVMQRHLKHRLPRKQGMYQLPTRKKSNQPDPHFYHGQHWDVGGSMSSSQVDDVGDEPLNMEHTTRRLTIHAVNDAEDAEQERRSKTESRDMKRAAAVLKPVNKELKTLVRNCKKAEKKEEKKMMKKTSEKKDAVMEEMLHKQHLKDIEGEEEEEREWRMSRMEDLTDPDKSSDSSTMADVKAMSKAAKFWSDVRQELEGAFHDLEDVNEEVDQAVDDLYRDLKDDFVLSFKRTAHLMKLHAIEEAEKRRRINEVKEMHMEGKLDQDPVRRKSVDVKEMAQDELKKIFASVKLSEIEEEERGMEETRVVMKDTMEELLHVRQGQMVDSACAEERTRRIMEAEEELAGKRPNPQKERMRDAIKKVQEQLLMEKFGAKMKENKKKNVKVISQEPTTEVVTKNDEKLRKLRTNARRQSCVSAC